MACPLQVQRQQPFENFLVTQSMRPAVCIEDSRIEFLVRQVEPRRALVVQVGQRALLELCLARAGRIQPRAALFDQLPRRERDGLHTWVALGFLARRPREREGFKGGCGSVTLSASSLTQLCTLCACPELMSLRMQNSEEVVIFSGNHD